MARRTKSDALATRDTILDCAEDLFIRQGVSHTTLQHIALQAGVTRGAIYWHFPDKAAVFNAMMQRVKMPLESAMQSMRLADPADPLGDLEACAVMVFVLTENNPRARRVFEIATLKIELVVEMDAVRARRSEVQASWMANAENKIRTAIQKGQAKADTQAYAGALGLWSLIDGLLRAWMIAPGSFNLSEMGRMVVASYLNSLRETPTAMWMRYDWRRAYGGATGPLNDALGLAKCIGDIWPGQQHIRSRYHVCRYKADRELAIDRCKA